MLRLSVQNLLKRVHQLKKRCRFCEFQEYGHGKFIICPDRPAHNQKQMYGAGKITRFQWKPEKTFEADPFRRQYEDLQKPQNGIGAPNWNKSRSHFDQHYNWTFSKHRFSKKY